MCFRKKSKYPTTIETILVSRIRTELNDKEEHICFNFGEQQYKFKFCNNYVSSYSTLQDFDFAESQINRALTLLLKSLVVIKDEFKGFGVDNKIVLDKIKSVLDMEEDFQLRMKQENVELQKSEHSIRMGTIMLFEALSREYMTFVINTKEELLDYVSANFVNFDILNTISKTLKEQPTVLPIDLKDYKYNLNGYCIVYNLENFLRVLIITILKRQTSKQMMDEETYRYLEEQKAKEESNKWCDERHGGDLFYLSFNHLISIIKYRKADFENAGIKLEKINNELDKVNTIRNKIAHNNIITEDDLNILQTNSSMIYKFFKDFHGDVASYKFNIKKTKNSDK